MKNIKYIFLFVAAVFLLNSCELETPSTDDLNYVTFEATGMDLGVNIDGANDYEITVYTTQTTGTDRTFNLMVNADATTADAAAYDVPATVVVPANSNVGVFTLGLTDVNIGDGQTLVIELSVAEGVFTGEPTEIMITQICDKNETFVNIVFDGYASECTWDLMDGTGAVIGSGSGYADGQASASTKFCLPNGSYSFTINDSYGDGLTYPGLGSIAIVSNGTEVVAFDGDFGATKTVDFDL